MPGGLGNRAHCTLIFIYWCCRFLKVLLDFLFCFVCVFFVLFCCVCVFWGVGVVLFGFFVLFCFFFVVFFLFLFFVFLEGVVHSSVEYEQFLNKPFWPIDTTLTSTTLPVQSGPGSNCNKRLLQIPQIPRTGVSLSDFWGFLLFCKGYSQYIYSKPRHHGNKLISFNLIRSRSFSFCNWFRFNPPWVITLSSDLILF